jgi:hypothetical protein
MGERRHHDAVLHKPLVRSSVLLSGAVHRDGVVAAASR